MSRSARDILMALLVSAYPDLRRKLAGRLGSTDLASEALHDTFLRLHRAEIAQEIQNPRSYLLAMATNIASNAARGEKRHLSAAEVETLIELPDEAPDPSREAEGRSELAAVERALRDLPARRQAIFRSFWVDGVNHGDLALKYALSERTVRHELLQASRYLHEATKDFYVVALQKRLSEVSSK